VQQPIATKATSASPQPRSRARLGWLTDFVYVVSVKRFINKVSGVMLDKEQFTDTFGFVKVGQQSGCAASHFLHRGRGQKLQHLTFCPGQPPIVCERGMLAFNAYRPTKGQSEAWERQALARARGARPA
jgi:hypothetical protein